MATIQFKAKPERRWTPDGIPYAGVRVPELDRKHCDMHAFRTHPRYGSYANSDLFKAMLARISRDVAPNGYIRLDALPENVTAESGSLLTTVRIEV